jgi:hypothetical protein
LLCSLDEQALSAREPALEGRERNAARLSAVRQRHPIDDAQRKRHPLIDR